MAMAAAATSRDAGEAGRWAVPLAEAVPEAKAVVSRIYGDGPGVKPYSEYKGRYLCVLLVLCCIAAALC